MGQVVVGPLILNLDNRWREWSVSCPGLYVQPTT